MADDRSPWPTITFLGVLCGLAVGMVIVMLWRQRRDEILLEPGSRRELEPPDRERGSWGSLPQLDLSPRASMATKMDTRSMLSRPLARTTYVSATEPTLVMQAVGKRSWKVWVRVIGPPGSQAVFSLSNSSGDAAVIPAGTAQPMHIPSGEFLYARGSTTMVQVSISGGEA